MVELQRTQRNLEGQADRDGLMAALHEEREHSAGLQRDVEALQ